MNWPQTVVVAWVQFLIGTIMILGLARLALRWVTQPVERIRLILGMFAAVLVLPLLSAQTALPVQRLGLITLRAPQSTDGPEINHRTDSGFANEEHLIVLVEPDPTFISGDRKVDADDSKESQHFATDLRENTTVAQAHPTTPFSDLSHTNSSLSTIALSRHDIWSALALAIVLLHAAGTVFFLIERVIGQIRLSKLCRGATDGPALLDRAWQEIAGLRGDAVRLLISGEIEVPLTFGWLRPAVIVPLSICVRGGSELKACLGHEWSHIERNDMLAWRFVNLCQLALWYQPLFWSLRRELRICQEFIADHRTVNDVITPLEYSELLLQLAKRRSLGGMGALTMFDQPSQLSRRVKMLLERHEPLNDRCRHKFTLSLLAIAIFLAAAVSSLRIDTIRADDTGAPRDKPPAAVKPPQVQPAANMPVGAKVDPSSTQNPPPTDPNVQRAARQPADIAESEKEAGNEKSLSPNWRTVTYKQTMEIDGQTRNVVVKEFLAEDGRKRTEHAGPGGLVVIFDKQGMPRLNLTEHGKSALTFKPAVIPESKPRKIRAQANQGLKEFGDLRIGHAQRWLERLKKLCDSPREKLGQKEIDGKIADGFVATQLWQEYTIWIDSATGDLVRVEHDSFINGSKAHVTMSEFRFGDKLDESLFSLEVPAGYKDNSILPVSSKSDSDEKRAAEAPTGMRLAWSNNGNWFRAAGVPNPRALQALDRLGSLTTFDEQGKRLAAISTEWFNTTNALRIADLDGDGKYEIITTGNFGSTVKAISANGDLLWSYARGDAPGHDWRANDICAADLNGDGGDEIVIGFNGATGLHVLNSDGTLLWKETSLGNVWHVAVGDVEGDARPEVVCTSATGKVQLFNCDGKPLRQLEAGLYANMVRISPASTESPIGTIIVAGTRSDSLNPNGVEKNEMVIAIDTNDKFHWSLEIEQRVVSATTCTPKPWLALTLADGTARVIDVTNGKEIARVGGQGGIADAAWMQTKKGDPLLVIANGSALNVFTIGTDAP